LLCARQSRDRTQAAARAAVSAPPPAPAYVRIRPHMSAYVSIRQHTSDEPPLARFSSAACASIRQHTSAYVRIRQHTSDGPPLAQPLQLRRLRLVLVCEALSY
jgi:hypothetical protein